jgi:hypothetical protein
MFLGMGVCDRCGANEIIAYSGHRRQCSRCNHRVFADISAAHKDNYMTYGSVHGERRERKFENKSKEIR